MQNILPSDDLSPSSTSDRKLPGCSTRLKLATDQLTVTDLEVLSAFLLPVLQETIQGEEDGVWQSMRSLFHQESEHVAPLAGSKRDRYSLG